MDLKEYVSRLKNHELVKYLLYCINVNIDECINANTKKIKKITHLSMNIKDLVFYIVKTLVIMEAVILSFSIYKILNNDLTIYNIIISQLVVIIFSSCVIKIKMDNFDAEVIKRKNEKIKLSKKLGVTPEKVVETLNNNNVELKNAKAILNAKDKKNDNVLHNIYSMNIIPSKYRNIVAIIKFYIYITNTPEYTIEDLTAKYDLAKYNYKYANKFERLSFRFTGSFKYLEDIAKREKNKQPTLFFYVSIIKNLADKYINSNENKLDVEESEKINKFIDEVISEDRDFEN